MDTLSTIFPYLIILLILLSLWGLYDRYRFTHFEGNLKRGVMIWAEPLTWQIRQFLDSLPASLQVEQSFIRKEYSEALIVEKQSSQTSIFSRRRGHLPCVAYVNLSAPESQIELRTSFFTLVSLTLNLIFVFIFFANFLSFGFLLATPAIWIVPVIFLFIFIGSFLYEFYQARQRLLKFLERVMSQQRSGSNMGF
jgi:hypothetical protein